MYPNPLLTIIVPIYNVESYLTQCLESIVHYHKQEELEIILVDDGSSDSSPEICKLYELTYNNIKYIRQSNGGLSNARNSGIKSARGNYILFLDSDDFLQAGIIDRLVEDIKSSNVDLYFGRAYKCIDESRELSQVDYEKYTNLSPADAFNRLVTESNFWFAAWLIIINREFLFRKQLFFKEGILHEDELWVPEVFIEAKTIKFLNYGFYCYRLNRPGSIVSQPNIKKELDKIVIAEELTKRLGVNSQQNEIIYRRRASLIFGILLKLDKYKLCTDYQLLLQILSKHLKYLCYGKYKLIYYLTKMIGIDLTTKIIGIYG